jgi:phage tail sheath protein FI
MAFERPGVYVQETLNPSQSTTGLSSDTIGAFVGPNDRGPITPTLVTSWSDYVNKFGSWNTTASNDLALAVYMFFANGGRQAYVNRVVGSGAAAATRTLLDRAGSPQSTLTLTAANPGVWAVNSGAYYGVSFSITDSVITGYFDLTVYFGGITAPYVVEKFTDLSMTSTDARYAPSVINTGSRYLVAAAVSGNTSTGATKNPALIAVASGSLSSGNDGTAVSSVTSYSAFDTIRNPLLLNVAGFTDATTVNAAIAYAVSRGDIFVIIDGKVASDGTDDTVANQLSLAATYTTTSYAAVYYPRVTISDPTRGTGSATGATKLVGQGGAVAGLFVSTDNSRGVFKAPAGLQSRIAGAVSVTPLTNANLDSLNSASAPVNAIRFVPGSGIVVMGARTLDPAYVSRYVPVRRTLIYLEKALSDLTQFAIFEPNDPALWRRLRSTVSSFLTNFWSQGGLRGVTPSQAFFVKIDDTNNPQSAIDNGEVHIEIGVALQRPAEFVVIKIGQFDGGTTVTVA